MTGVLIVVVALLSIAATAFFVIRSESRKGPACCEGKKCRVGPAHGRGHGANSMSDSWSRRERRR